MKLHFNLALLACTIGSASASQYVIDDGTPDLALGVLNGRELLWTNSFVIEEGCETITGIDIMLGIISSPIPNGVPITLFIGADANIDGILDQGGVLSLLNSTVMGASTETFVTYDLADVTFNVGDGFVVGAVWAPNAPDLFAACVDLTPPTFLRRSYVAIGPAGTIDPNNINAIPSQRFYEGYFPDFPATSCSGLTAIPCRNPQPSSRWRWVLSWSFAGGTRSLDSQRCRSLSAFPLLSRAARKGGFLLAYPTSSTPGSGITNVCRPVAVSTNRIAAA